MKEAFVDGAANKTAGTFWESTQISTIIFLSVFKFCPCQKPEIADWSVAHGRSKRYMEKNVKKKVDGIGVVEYV